MQAALQRFVDRIRDLKLSLLLQHSLVLGQSSADLFALHETAEASAAASAHPARITPGQWRQIADSIVHEATKFTVAMKEGQPSPEDIPVIVQPFDKILSTLVGAYHTIVAGPTLQQTLGRAIERLLTSIEQVVNCFFPVQQQSLRKKQRKHPNTSETEAVATGIVWQQCEELGKFPVENKLAIANEVQKWLGTIQDALKESRDLEIELKESLQDPDEDEQGLGDGPDDDNDDDDDDFLDWKSSKPLEEEMKRIEASTGIIKSAASLVQMLHKLLTTYQINDTHRPAVAAMEDLRLQSELLAGLIDNLGASLHPPQDGSEVCNAAQEVHAKCAQIMQSIRSHQEILFPEAQKRNSSATVMQLIDKQLQDSLAVVLSTTATTQYKSA